MLIDGDDVQATASLDSALVYQATGSAHSDKGSEDKTGVHLLNVQLHVLSLLLSLSLHTQTCTHTYTPIATPQDEAQTTK